MCSMMIKWRLAACSAHLTNNWAAMLASWHAFPLSHFWSFSKAWWPCLPSVHIKWLLSTGPALTRVQALIIDDCNSPSWACVRVDSIFGESLWDSFLQLQIDSLPTLPSELCHKDTMPLGPLKLHSGHMPITAPPVASPRLLCTS